MSARSDKIAELREAIAGQVQLKKYYISFQHVEQQERQRNEAARLRANAAKLTADADRIDATIAGWKDGYYQADARVMELRAELIETENADKIERLKELAEQLAGVA